MTFFTPEQAAQLASGTPRIGWLAELFFKSETIRLWNGDTLLDAGSRRWKPTFGQVQIDGVGWDGMPTSRQITMAVSGVSTEMLALALAETNEADQQMATIALQFFDNEWQTIGAPVPFFYGLMQPPMVSRSETGEQGAVQSVTLPIENLFYNRSKASNGRYTDRDQQHRHPGDLFFSFTPSLVFKTITWPDYG